MPSFICPTCSTRIDPSERCPSTVGLGRCMELVGHNGWHWSDVGRGGVMRWTGLYVVGNSCPGRLSLIDWCQLKPGHEGAHNNGHGVTFSEVLQDA